MAGHHVGVPLQRVVRSSVVRLPPAVHSLGRYSFVSGLIDIARATGISGYLGAFSA